MDSRHGITTFLLPLCSWGTLVVPKSTSRGWEDLIFGHKPRAQANSMKRKDFSWLLLSGRREHKLYQLAQAPARVQGKAQANARSKLARRVRKRNNFSTCATRVIYLTSKLAATAEAGMLLSMAPQLASNTLELHAVARWRSENDDLTPPVATLAKTSKQDYRGSLETYLLARPLISSVLSSAYKEQEFRDRENVQFSYRTELNLGE
jgi:hypothetical protein